MNEASIVAAALEKKSAAERAAYLDQACAGDTALRQRVEELLQGRQNASFEPTIREALAAAQRALPKGSADIPHIQSLLGACLVAQDRFDEAEPLVVSASETMSQIPAARPDRLRLALEHVVQLYDAWKKPDQAAAWRAKLPPAKAPD